jgi:hypothetical protein
MRKEVFVENKEEVLVENIERAENAVDEGER